MKKIQKGGLRRRFSIGIAGARSGVGLLQSKAAGMLLPKDQQQAHNEQALQREAERFVKQLGELKGAYVKIGQMLALYGEHLLPSAVTNALHTLESSTTALDWQTIEPCLYAELDSHSLEQLTINPTPLAAASLAQVHRATLRADQSDVCVKIQYPDIADTIEDDFKNVLQMLTLARWIESGRQLQRLSKELKQFLLKEVDYQYELNTAERVRCLLANDPRYKIPQYYAKLCTTKILTMEYISGFEVTHSKVQALSQARRNRLAESMLELFFKEAFEWRLMQTDPNFGNYRILIAEKGKTNDQLVLLDFGAVHDLPDLFSDALQRTILAAQRMQQEAIIDGLIDLNCLRDSDNDSVKESFAQFCSFLLEPFREDLNDVPDIAKEKNTYHWRQSQLLKRAGKLGSQRVRHKGFTIPPSEFMLMVRKLTGVFTFVSALGAKTHSAYLLNQYRND